MNRTIEADFFLPAVEAIKDTSRALIVDDNHDTARSAEPSLNEASRSTSFEASDTKASFKRAEF